MIFDIKELDLSKISVSESEKKLILKARKNYISWDDRWISIEKSYAKFLSKFDNLK